MSQIGNLITGAGVRTQFIENQLYQYLLIETVDLDLPIQGLTITISGDNPINIQNQAMIQAFSKFGMAGLLGADVKKGMLIPISDGGKGNKAVTITMENAGATTPAVFGFSKKPSSGQVIRAIVQTINANSNFYFEGFAGLIFDPANLAQATVTFMDPSTGREWVEGDISEAELDALFASRPNTTTDADGKLAGLTVVDGSATIKGVRLFATGGQLDVLIINSQPLP